MKVLHSTMAAVGMFLLVACGTGVKPAGSDELAAESMSDRLNRSYGYQVDEQGNWAPNSDKRSQYEGRGGSGHFSGGVSKKSFGTNRLNKGSWIGGSDIKKPSHRENGSKSSIASVNRFNNQKASLDRNLRTPARIAGNRIPDRRALESNGNTVSKPLDTETDARRRVFSQPDIIDYRQQREMSIRQSRNLLGRDK